MTKDVFQVLAIETKEDKYTFALNAFFENVQFKEKAGKYFGFQESDYKSIRESIKLENPTQNRRVITPDIILYNGSHIAVIESKMFSSEGYMQTQDYAAAENDIVKFINGKENANKRTVSFYYFTLSKSAAGNSYFETISWAEFYKETLNNIDFDDAVLNCLRDAIFDQAVRYTKVAGNLEQLRYRDLFQSESYWVRPFSLFASGVNNSLWKLDPDYVIYNHVVSGPGHGDFTSDLKKACWHLEGQEDNDNTHLFIRCEWDRDSLGIYLNWENFNIKKHLYEDNIVYDYVATKDLNLALQERVIANKHAYLETWKKECAPELVTITSKKKSVLRMLKCTIDCSDMTIENVLMKAREVIQYYEKEIDGIRKCTEIQDGYLTYIGRQ